MIQRDQVIEAQRFTADPVMMTLSSTLGQWNSVLVRNPAKFGYYRAFEIKNQTINTWARDVIIIVCEEKKMNAGLPIC